MAFLGRRYGAVRYGEYVYDKGVNALSGTAASHTTASSRLSQSTGSGMGGLVITDAPRDGLVVTDQH